MKELNKLIKAFSNYRLGKERLIELRKRRGYREISEREIQEMIHNNQQIREQYNTLLLDIASSLKKQLKSS